MKNHRSPVQNKRMVKQQKTLNSSREEMSYRETTLNDISQEQGSNSATNEMAEV